jgi:hypothetical protein
MNQSLQNSNRSDVPFYLTTDIDETRADVNSLAKQMGY